MSQNFVKFNCVTPEGTVKGALLIRAVDVRRVVPFNEQITVLFAELNSDAFFKTGSESYLVQGNSTEVSEKLFGLTDVQKLEQEVVNLKHDMKQHVCPAPVGDRSNSAHWQQKYNEAMQNYTRVSKDYDVITTRLSDVLKEKTELEQRLNSLILNPCVIIALH